MRIVAQLVTSFSIHQQYICITKDTMVQRTLCLVVVLRMIVQWKIIFADNTSRLMSHRIYYQAIRIPSIFLSHFGMVSNCSLIIFNDCSKVFSCFTCYFCTSRRNDCPLTANIVFTISGLKISSWLAPAPSVTKSRT